jgi:hypothetical protein
VEYRRKGFLYRARAGVVSSPSLHWIPRSRRTRLTPQKRNASCRDGFVTHTAFSTPHVALLGLVTAEHLNEVMRSRATSELRHRHHLGQWRARLGRMGAGYKSSTLDHGSPWSASAGGVVTRPRLLREGNCLGRAGYCPTVEDLSLPMPELRQSRYRMGSGRRAPPYAITPKGLRQYLAPARWGGRFSHARDEMRTQSAD